MPKVGVRELKNRASEILRAVREEGAEYIITYQGRPMAVLLPIEEEELEDYVLAHPHFVELRERARQVIRRDEFVGSQELRPSTPPKVVSRVPDAQTVAQRVARLVVPAPVNTLLSANNAVRESSRLLRSG